MLRNFNTSTAFMCWDRETIYYVSTWNSLQYSLRVLQSFSKSISAARLSEFKTHWRVHWLIHILWHSDGSGRGAATFWSRTVALWTSLNVASAWKVLHKEETLIQVRKLATIDADAASGLLWRRCRLILKNSLYPNEENEKGASASTGYSEWKRKWNLVLIHGKKVRRKLSRTMGAGIRFLER